MSKLRPILFKGEMVNAILAGRKTQTRRLVKFPPKATAELLPGETITLTRMQDGFDDGVRPIWGNDDEPNWFSMAAPVQVGDVLWVRETWGEVVFSEDEGCYVFRADVDENPPTGYPELFEGWKPSLFMPRNACRLYLKVTSVRAERLQDISEADAIAEGVASTQVTTVCSGTNIQYRYQNYLNRHDIHHPMHRWSMAAKHSYETLWDKINGKGAWSTNPYVWVYEFEQTDKPTTP